MSEKENSGCLGSKEVETKNKTGIQRNRHNLFPLLGFVSGCSQSRDVHFQQKSFALVILLASAPVLAPGTLKGSPCLLCHLSSCIQYTARLLLSLRSDAKQVCFPQISPFKLIVSSVSGGKQGEG